ncbi:MAG: hypothetical protein RLY97_931 [Pseudomonadota bacterium]
MRAQFLKSCVSVAVLAAATMAAPAFAADKPAAPAAAKAEEDTLSTIVVTASTGDRSKLNSSVSVSSVSADVINNFRPQSQAELFRLLPGLQSPGTGGPGGNANIAVRGLPVATGGATFVQMQEDGLPTVLYGDIQFGNNDYWTHFGPTDERVEAIRGGTTSTLASQAPGAVINYISKTSKSEGGYAELEKGVNYDYTKVKFLASGIINDTTYYNVGGYVDVGHGPLHAGYNVSKSYQIKGNVTKEFADDKGYLRMFFKLADTQEPDYNASLASGTITGGTGAGGKVTGLKPYATFDGRKQSGGYSLNNREFYYVDVDGTRKQQQMNGITTKAKSIQLQLHYNVSDGLKLDDNFRYTSMSGGFASPFFSADPTAGVIGSTVNGSAVATVRYANGPNAGALYTNPYINTNVDVYTRIRDIGSFVNDLKLSGKYDIGGGMKASVQAGWFFMSQRIAMDWHVQKTYSEAAGNNPSMVNLYNAAGALLTANGIAGYGNNWGDCCARTYDYTFTDNAPYLNVTLDGDKFQFDASIRHDINNGSGTGQKSTGTAYNYAVTQVNPATGTTVTTQIPYFLPDAPAEVLNYTKATTSWSVGALYKPADNTSVFIRASRGARFNADRMSFNGYFNKDGTLNSTTGAAAVADYVNQYEIGLKNRGDLAGGRYTVELTVFKSNFNITTYELNPVKCAPAAACIVANKYKTTGFEFFGTYKNGGFNFMANATYNKSKKQPSGTATFAPSDGIPDFSYTLAANYNVSQMASLGMNVTGQTSSLDGNGLKYPGSAVFGANFTVNPAKNLQLGVNIYNLFNTFALQGPGNNVVTSNGANSVFNVTNAAGRTVTGSIKFNF